VAGQIRRFPRRCKSRAAARYSVAPPVAAAT
jgi:hypothetical protein